ncbi:MAG: hypothetical protein U5O39_04885 [Gammaproteobacteria bacterium]|nr:hypothetical protein [Gammaproteobacteria bacterium]
MLEAFIDNLDAGCTRRVHAGVVPSSRIAAQARERGFRHALIADGTAEDAMVQAVLQSRS